MKYVTNPPELESNLNGAKALSDNSGSFFSSPVVNSSSRKDARARTERQYPWANDEGQGASIEGPQRPPANS